MKLTNLGWGQRIQKVYKLKITSVTMLNKRGWFNFSLAFLVSFVFFSFLFLSIVANADSTNQVWFSPAVGSSDFDELFDSSKLTTWETSRGLIDVFVVNEETVDSVDNLNGYDLLVGEGIEIALEVSVFGPGKCDGGDSASDTIGLINQIGGTGNSVSYLVMRRPLFDGRNFCKMNDEETANELDSYIDDISSHDSSIKIGELESYPIFNVDDLTSWNEILKDKNIDLDFFQLDVDMEFAEDWDNDNSLDISLGSDEIVFEWAKLPEDGGACFPADTIDVGPRAFIDSNGKVQVIASTSVSRRLIGNSLDSVAKDCSVIYRSERDTDHSHYSFSQYLSVPYTLDGSNIYILTQDKYAETGGDFWVSLTLFSSSNIGVSYSMVGADGAHLVATPPYQYRLFENEPVGYFEPSNIIEKGGDYYSFFKVNNVSNQNSGTCLMRTADVTSPSSWEYLSSSGSTNNPIDPYPTEPSRPVDYTCFPIEFSKISNMSASITWNSYLGKYILVDYSSLNGVDGFYYSLSNDLLVWSDRKLLMATTGNKKYYPAMIEETILEIGGEEILGARNFEVTRRTPYLYFVEWIDEAGENRNRNLIRKQITFNKEKGAVGSDLEDISDYFSDENIDFGVVITANHYDSNTNSNYYDDAIDFSNDVYDAIGAPDQIIFRSEYTDIPVNLPEGTSTKSHTKLIIDSWITFGGNVSEGNDTSPVCGNGILESGEQCDDGNTISNDGCSSACQNESTGGTQINWNLNLDAQPSYTITTAVGGILNIISGGKQYTLDITEAGTQTITFKISGTSYDSFITLLLDKGLKIDFDKDGNNDALFILDSISPSGESIILISKISSVSTSGNEVSSWKIWTFIGIVILIALIILIVLLRKLKVGSDDRRAAYV